MNTYQPTPNLKIADDVYRTSLEGLLYIPHHNFPDERGFYAEIARIPEVEKVLGHEFIVKQVNHSRSKQNVLRGFHAEAWNKLVTITSGRVLSVLVDIRPDSPTFGQSEKFVLGFGDDALAGGIFVSSGIANGFCVLEGPSDYIYAVDELYKNRDKSGDQSIALFDPDIGIDWPIPQSKRIFSDRDEDSKTLRALFPDKF